MREGPTGARTEADLLTDREWDCLCYVVERYSSKQIAARLGVAPKTVDSYLDTARVKLGARTRQEAAQMLVARYGAVYPRKGFPGESLPGDGVRETGSDPRFFAQGAGGGRAFGREPGRPHRARDFANGADRGVPGAVSAARSEPGRAVAADQLGADRAATAQPGGRGLRTGALRSGPPEMFYRELLTLAWSLIDGAKPSRETEAAMD
jgi:DNA-binding CsgD family transcriptional regulator